VHRSQPSFANAIAQDTLRRRLSVAPMSDSTAEVEFAWISLLA